MADLDALRVDIADACRVLAARGLADGVLGHVSVRIGENAMLIRCRGPRERGLAYTEPADVRMVDLDGNGELDGPGGPWSVPAELPLHSEVLRARPEVRCVVHAHPFAVVAADLAGHLIQPILGAYDIPGAHLAADGVPVYPRSVLVRSRALAVEVVAAMGERPVVLMRGHGLTAVGDDPAEAVLRAASVDTVARMTVVVLSAGGTPTPISQADLAELPDLGAKFTRETAWRHELARAGAPTRVDL